MSSRRVTARFLVCLAAAGCATAPERRDSEAVFDCPRLVAALATPPPIAGPDRGQPAGLWSDGRRFGLFRRPTLDKSQIQPEGSLWDHRLDTDDPRTRAYLDEIKRRIFAVWSYPKAAAEQKQSGSGVVVFMAKQDGRIGKVDVVRSTGSPILDRYMANAIRLAAPFPPLPCKIAEEATPVTLSFEYVLRDPPRGVQP